MKTAMLALARSLGGGPDPEGHAWPPQFPATFADTASAIELALAGEGDRCAALHGGLVELGKTTRFHCVIYDDRPRTCRDFTLGSARCLTARRRVGLSL